MKATLRTLADIDRLNQALLGQELPLEVTWKKHKLTRSQQQNRLMWRWFTDIKTHVYETMGKIWIEAGIHDDFRELFLPVELREDIHGKTRKIRTSTTTLSVPEMAEYLTKIDQWVIENLGLILPTQEQV